MDDLISRQAAIDLVRDVCDAIMSGCESWYDPETGDEVYKDIREVDAILKCNKEVRIALRNMPSVQPQWIPCSERLPCDGIPVNITWVNRKPVSYYVDIKDKHFTATGIYYRGKWFWYSWACEDLLYEYGNSKADAVDEDVEIVAWMPLPEPWKELDEVFHEEGEEE